MESSEPHGGPGCLEYQCVILQGILHRDETSSAREHQQGVNTMNGCVKNLKCNQPIRVSGNMTSRVKGQEAWSHNLGSIFAETDETWRCAVSPGWAVMEQGELGMMLSLLPSDFRNRGKSARGMKSTC